MTFLLHGTNTSKINTQLTGLKKQLVEKETEKLEFDKSNFDASLVRNGLNSVDFFGNSPCVIVNLTDFPKASFSELYQVMSEAKQNPKLILYAYKTLPKTHEIIKNTSKVKMNVVLHENIDNKDIFKLSDGVLSNNRALIYKSIKNLLDDPEDPDPIPVMAYLNTMVRNILLINIDAPKAKDINPYVYSKIAPIAKRTNTEELKKLIKTFYNIDKDVKQGRTTPEIALSLLTEKVITCLYDKKIH